MNLGISEGFSWKLHYLVLLTKNSILKERLILFPNKIRIGNQTKIQLLQASGLHYFSRKKAAVSSLEWQFPHDDYKPRERPAAACTSHGSGLSAQWRRPPWRGLKLHRPTVGPNTKNTPIIRFEKFVNWRIIIVSSTVGQILKDRKRKLW